MMSGLRLILLLSVMFVFIPVLLAAAALIKSAPAVWLNHFIFTHEAELTKIISLYVLPGLLVITALIRKAFNKKPEILKGTALFFIAYIAVNALFGGFSKSALKYLLMWYYSAALPVFLFVLLERFEAAIPVALKRAFEVSKTAVTNIGLALKALLGKVPKSRIIPALGKTAVVIVSVLSISLLYAGGKAVYDKFFVQASLQPKGEASVNTAFTAVFSQAVKLKIPEDQLKCFEIDPPVEGRYRFENGKKVDFIPAQPLKPATTYTFSLDLSPFDAGKDKSIVNAGRSVFTTTKLQAVEMKYFRDEELLKGSRKDLICEITFNMPVETDSLKKSLRVIRLEREGISFMGGKQYDAEFSLEPTQDPLKFNVRVRNLSRNENNQTVTVTVQPGVMCKGCEKGSGEVFRQSFNLAAKIKLKAEEISPTYEGGNMGLSIRFNTAVTEEAVRKFVKVYEDGDQAAMKYTAEVNLRQVSLKGDFKARSSYRVVIDKNMVSKSGDLMASEHSQTVSIDDLPAYVDFAETGDVLANNGNMTVSIKSVNMQAVNINVYKVYKNNIVHYLKNRNDYYYGGGFGKIVLSANYNLSNEGINKEALDQISLKQFNDSPYRGIYQISLASGDDWYNRKFRTVLCTDIGIIAKEAGDDLLVRLFSVKTHAPVAGARLSVLSYDNQVITEKAADAQGRALIRNWKKNTQGFEPFILLVESGEDFSYLDFRESRLNSKRFDVSGAVSEGSGITAFVESDRGLYRPGDRVRMVTILRNSDLTTPPSVFAECRLTGPTGENVYTGKAKSDENGMCVFEYDSPNYVKTGAYTAEITVNGKKCGSNSLKIEEFIPDKISVEMEASKKTYRLSENIDFKVKAKQMFGPPAANNRASAGVSFISYSFQSAKFDDYVFYDPEKQYSKRDENLGEVYLDANGEYSFSLGIPADVDPPSALKAEIIAEVFDDGGRAVSAYSEAVIHPYNVYYGIKSAKEGASYDRNSKITFNIAAVDADDNTVNAKDVPVIVQKREWYSVYRRNSWRNGFYDSREYMETVAEGLVDIKDGKGVFEYIPKEGYGEYRIYVGGMEGMRTGTTFYVNWGYYYDDYGYGHRSSDMGAAEKLSVALDKKKYDAGDTASVNIQSPFDGTAYITVERDSVMEEYVVPVEKNRAVLKLTVKDSYLPNVYVSALVFRKPSETDLGLPYAAFGIANLSINREKLDLKPVITASDTATSGSGIDVTVQAQKPGAGVIIAAMDEGILQIVKYATPDPLGFFYGKKALQTETFSIFNRLLSDLKLKKQPLGGDSSEPSRKHLNPVIAKIVEPYAKFSGILKAGPDGTVRYKFDTKNFNGRVRLMAIAASSQRFGSASKYVTVSDPVTVNSYLPRFLAPKDEFTLTVKVYNNTGKEDDFTVKASASGCAELLNGTESFRLKPKEEKKIFFTGRASDCTGITVFTINTEGAGEKVTQKKELGVRPETHIETIVSTGVLSSGSETVINTQPEEFRYNNSIKVMMSRLRTAEYLPAIERLIHYPYGCVEQTSSATYPMIFMKDAGVLSGGKARSGEVDRYVAAGISRLQTFMMPSGALSYWPGADYPASPYTQQYVANLLIDARNAGYYVPETFFRNVLKAGGINLDSDDEINIGISYGDYYGYSEYNGSYYKYYLRSLAGKPPVKQLKNAEVSLVTYFSSKKALKAKLDEAGYTDKDVTELKREEKDASGINEGLYLSLTETDRLLLSMAFSQSGNYRAAKLLLEDEYRPLKKPRDHGWTYYSDTKYLGMYLKASAAADRSLTDRVIKAEKKILEILKKDKYFGSTQDACWVLRGLSATADLVSGDDMMKAEIYADSRLVESAVNTRAVYVTDEKGAWKAVKLKNTGKTELTYSVMVEGQPKGKSWWPESSGISVKREYLDANGRPLDMSKVEQGELATVKIDLNAHESMDNVVVVDMLPAGFEIENARLKSRGSLGFEPSSTLNLAYQDIRDDRIILFTREISGNYTFYYTVRAVTPGKYIVPNIFAEAMYDPEVKGESASSPDTLTVIQR